MVWCGGGHCEHMWLVATAPFGCPHLYMHKYLSLYLCLHLGSLLLTCFLLLSGFVLASAFAIFSLSLSLLSLSLSTSPSPPLPLLVCLWYPHKCYNTNTPLLMFPSLPCAFFYVALLLFPSPSSFSLSLSPSYTLSLPSSLSPSSLPPYLSLVPGVCHQGQDIHRVWNAIWETETSDWSECHYPTDPLHVP